MANFYCDSVIAAPLLHTEDRTLAKSTVFADKVPIFASRLTTYSIRRAVSHII